LDHLGTPRLITDASGRKVSAHNYYPFGGEITWNEGVNETFTFTGHERDSSLTTTVQNQDYWYYMHARYDSPNLSRFLSVDPDDAVHLQSGSESDRQRFQNHLRRPQSWNRYSYTENNPLTYVDGSGRERQLPSCVGFQAYARCTPAERVGRGPVGTQVFKFAAFTVGLFFAPGIIDFVGEALSGLAVRAATGPGVAIAQRVLNDPNRMNHIFGNEEHNLTALTERLGGANRAVGAVADRLGAIGAANLPTQENGVFSTLISVGGEVVRVTGRVIDGQINISDFWIPKI